MVVPGKPSNPAGLQVLVARFLLAELKTVQWIKCRAKLAVKPLDTVKYAVLIVCAGDICFAAKHCLEI